MIKDAGGIDFQILGIGRTGHVGFNEPGSPRDSRTRLITLDQRHAHGRRQRFLRRVERAAQGDHDGRGYDPERATSRADGVGRAQGAGHPAAPSKARSPRTIAASFLQQHANARIVLDTAAAAELTRFKTPWLLGSMEDFGLQWDDRQRPARPRSGWPRRSTSRCLSSPTKTTTSTACRSFRQSRGGAYDINIEVFRTLQATITGWPGGKPNKRSGRTARSAPARSPIAIPTIFPKRVVVFSPHPDDDVISHGRHASSACASRGTKCTSRIRPAATSPSSISAAIRHADFVREYAQAFGLGERQAERIEDADRELRRHRSSPARWTAPSCRRSRALIRRTEARAAARFSGVQRGEHPLPRHAVLRDRTRAQEAARAKMTSRSSWTCSKT